MFNQDSVFRARRNFYLFKSHSFVRLSSALFLVFIVVIATMKYNLLEQFKKKELAGI